MTKVIGVRFKTSRRIYYFDPLEFEIKEGDGVIVETARGQEYGEVIQGATEVEDTMIVSPLKPVVRIATEQDRSMRDQNSGKEDDAFAVCQKKIEQHGLDMKLVDVEYSFNGSKVIFYFTADERVDFRELVKDLAGQFRTRIELRQIGVRDEAKMLGGLGSCGRPVCCKTFLDDFRPVSIKMAKEQNLSLSPTKISGLCGRLMCCLQYEQSGYEEMKKKMPKLNREINTPDGMGIAIDNNVITEKTRVRLTLPDGSIDVREFHYTLLAKPGEPLPQPIAAEPAQQAEASVTTQRPPAERVGNNVEPVGGAESGNGMDAAQRNKRRRGGRGKSRTQSGGTQQAPTAAPMRNAEGGQAAPQQQQSRQPAPNRQQQQRQPAQNRPQQQPQRQQRPAESADAARADAQTPPADGMAAGAPRKRRRRGGRRNHPEAQKTE